MDESVFPKDSWRRRCIVIVTPEEFNRIQYESAQLTSNQEVCILDIGKLNSSDLPFKIIGNPPIKPGLLLVQSPCLDRYYADIVDAEHKFAVARYMDFFTFVNYLGATKVSVTQMEIRHKNSSIKVDLNASTGTTKFKSDLLYEEADKIKNDMRFNRKCTGSAPDLKLAEDFLQKNNLLGDLQMWPLLESARNVNNPLLSQDFLLNVSSYAASNLKLAASISSALGSIQTEIKRNTEEFFQYTLEVHVEFIGDRSVS